MSIRKGSISAPSSPKQLTSASSMPELSFAGLAPLPPPSAAGRFGQRNAASLSGHGAFSPHHDPHPQQQHQATFAKPALAALRIPRRSRLSESALPTLHEPGALSALHMPTGVGAAPATPSKSPRFRFSLRTLSQRVARRQSGLPQLDMLNAAQNGSSMPSSPLFSPPVSPSPRRATFRKGTLRISREQQRSSTAPLALPLSERSSSDVFSQSNCSTPRVSEATHATHASSFLDMGVGKGELLWAEENAEAQYCRSAYGASSSRPSTASSTSRTKRLLNKWLPRTSSDRSAEDFAAQTLPALPGSSRPSLPWTAQTAQQMSSLFGGSGGKARSASVERSTQEHASPIPRGRTVDSQDVFWRTGPRQSSGSRGRASASQLLTDAAALESRTASSSPTQPRISLSISRSLRRRKPKRMPSSESSSESSSSRAFGNVVRRSPFELRMPLPRTPAASLPPLPSLPTSPSASAVPSPARPVAPFIETTRPAIHPWSTASRTSCASPAQTSTSISMLSCAPSSSSSVDSDSIDAVPLRMLSPTPDFSAGQPLLLSPLSLSASRVSLLQPRRSGEYDSPPSSPREATLRASSELQRAASVGTSSFASAPYGIDCASTRSSAALDPFAYATYASSCAAADGAVGEQERKEMLMSTLPAAESSDEEELGSLADFRTQHTWHSAREVQGSR
ncbi:hypothetical protein FA09DRAFT_341251 [Tilletiopsis washingtonensis]|uniref:Uncharacterized protein n=1 Tax=Tilletiopsis washingtonensis TaxID=58919 RepID=A0A316Z0Q3_9BASI|nr:hypothetical protein FA09DRAFT_341251 [Tilletiopsis washingtonensis]PWN95327.1 hypothetical protein FA09DRAFT_341251 [Tilletiopsis washingtonensis]